MTKFTDGDFIFGRCTAEEAGLAPWPENTLPENDKSVIISPKWKVKATWDKFIYLTDEERAFWGNKIDELWEQQMRETYASLAKP